MILKVLCMDFSKILKYKKILRQDNIDILNCKRAGMMTTLSHQYS